MKFLTVLIALLFLGALPGQGNQAGSIKAAIFKDLDLVKVKKKKQLLGYLSRMQKQAEGVQADSQMLDFFNIKRKYYKLTKSSTPPAKLKAMVDGLKGAIQKHYIHNYLSFYDILFIDIDGDVFFTMRKEADYHKNIFSGDLAKTALSKHLKNSPMERFVDYQYYAASSTPSAFFVEPVIKGKRQYGWFVFQFTTRKINSIFNIDKGLGMTGEAFLVNREREMLTDSRFFGTSSILKRHLSIKNITEKFKERSGHKVVYDYRGFKALSSFEVCPILGSEWLLITKIDEDEVISWKYRASKSALIPQIYSYYKKAVPTFAKPVPLPREPIHVNMDEFRRVGNDEEVITFGVSTCTAVVVSYPGKFTYMAHLSVYDSVYGNGPTDLIGQVLKRINYFEIPLSKLRQLEIIVVANHQNSLARAVDKFLNAGYFLSQIKFMCNPAAEYGYVFHNNAISRTMVVWKGRADGREKFQDAKTVKPLGDLVKSLLDYK